MICFYRNERALSYKPVICITNNTTIRAAVIDRLTPSVQSDSRIQQLGGIRGIHVARLLITETVLALLNVWRGISYRLINLPTMCKIPVEDQILMGQAASQSGTAFLWFYKNEQAETSSIPRRAFRSCSHLLSFFFFFLKPAFRLDYSQRGCNQWGLVISDRETRLMVWRLLALPSSCCFSQAKQYGSKQTPTHPVLGIPVGAVEQQSLASSGAAEGVQMQSL